MPSHLRRIELRAKVNEASALLTVEHTPLVEAMGGVAAWWVAHDETNAERLLSLLVEGEDGWQVRPVRLQLTTKAGAVADAEALTRIGSTMVVAGSGFVDGSLRWDPRRSFLAFIDEHSMEVRGKGKKLTARGKVTVLPLHDLLIDRFHAAAPPIRPVVNSMVKASKKAPLSGRPPLNIEGIAAVADDLVFGLRWPVHESGAPFLLIWHGGADVLATAASHNGGTLTEGECDAIVAELMRCGSSVAVVDDGLSSERQPAGIRGLSVAADGALHALVGSTERKLTLNHKGKPGVGRAPFRHVAIEAHQRPLATDDAGSGAIPTVAAHVIRAFENVDRVEAVAERNDRWLYAIDDERAVVVLIDE